MVVAKKVSYFLENGSTDNHCSKEKSYKNRLTYVEHNIQTVFWIVKQKKNKNKYTASKYVFDIIL